MYVGTSIVLPSSKIGKGAVDSEKIGEKRNKYIYLSKYVNKCSALHKDKRCTYVNLALYGEVECTEACRRN
jgi:hypothetical protein